MAAAIKALPLTDKPLKDIDEWEDVKRETGKRKRDTFEEEEKQFEEEDKHFQTTNSSKKQEEFRNFSGSGRQKRIQHFYELQHSLQTYEFVTEMEKKYLTRLYSSELLPGTLQMGIWEALEFLNRVVDDSDPDTNLSQVQHALQTAEAIREKWPEEEFDWLPLTGLIHDLGKILAVTDEAKGLVGLPQWATVGDTFPVGLPYSKKNVFYEYFEKNPDFKDPKYNSGLGVYKAGCGLMKNIKMSWGHDEYMYHVCVANKSKLPTAALYMIRFHSFYPWHKEGAYSELMDAEDRFNLDLIKEFNSFDLYSKSRDALSIDELKPYYVKLIGKYFPETVRW